MCGVCEQDHKIQDGRLVHHGYRRPGHGSIEGDCYAVGYEPYERSLTATNEYRAMMVQVLKHTEEVLAKLQARPATLTVKRRAPGEKVWARDPEMIDVELPRFDAAGNENWEYARELESAIRQVEWSAKSQRREVERLDGLVAKWELRPLREVTEEVIAQTKAEAQAKRDAKAAEAKAKRDAKQAKKDAREAKYKAMAEGFAEDLKKLAAQVEGGKLTPAQREAAYKLSKKIRNSPNYYGTLEVFKAQNLADVVKLLGIGDTFSNGNIHLHW
jgi:hypothetical protein